MKIFLFILVCCACGQTWAFDLAALNTAFGYYEGLQAARDAAVKALEDKKKEVVEETRQKNEDLAKLQERVEALNKTIESLRDPLKAAKEWGQKAGSAYQSDAKRTAGNVKDSQSKNNSLFSAEGTQPRTIELTSSDGRKASYNYDPASRRYKGEGGSFELEKSGDTSVIKGGPANEPGVRAAYESRDLVDSLGNAIDSSKYSHPSLSTESQGKFLSESAAGVRSLFDELNSTFKRDLPSTSSQPSEIASPNETANPSDKSPALLDLPNRMPAAPPLPAGSEVLNPADLKQVAENQGRIIFRQQEGGLYVIPLEKNKRPTLTVSPR